MAPKPTEIDPSAEAEALEAYRWYRERSERAAGAFFDELERALVAIQADPARFGDYMHGCRRRMLKRYPYLVVYRELDEMIQVIAVAHTRRRPGYWKNRASDA